jgi:hypothetical protein
METKSRPLANGDTISQKDLTRLLIQIKEFRTDVHVRFRILGKAWLKNFCRVFVVNETGIVLIDPIDSKVEIIPNFEDIVEFEIDCRFQQYNSYVPYQVVSFTS